VEAGLIRRLRSGWTDTIVVCGKCSKKLDGGFGEGGRTSLVKALRKRLGLGKGRKAAVGIVETKCLGVCPKRAVVVACAGEWLVVPAGENVDAVASALGLAAPISANDSASGLIAASVMRSSRLLPSSRRYARDDDQNGEPLLGVVERS